MERTISEKHLSNFNKAKLHHDVVKPKNQIDCLYGTMRKKGSVKILADHYDKYSKTNFVNPKRGEFMKSSSQESGSPYSSSKICSNVTKFNTVRVKNVRKPQVTDYFADNESTCYSLETKPPDFKSDQPIDHFYEKIYESNKQSTDYKKMDNLTTIQTQKISEISPIKTAEPPPNEIINTGIRNEIASIFPSNYSIQTETPKNEDEGIYDKAMVVDTSKSDKNDSDEGEDLSYFHVLFFKNRDRFSSLPKAIKTSFIQTEDKNFKSPIQKCLPEPDCIKINDRESESKKGRISLDIYKKRKCAITNIINSEKKYVASLEVISQYKSSFEKAHTASDYLCAADVKFLFDDCLLFLERHLVVLKAFALLEGQLNSGDNVSVGGPVLELALQEFEIGIRYLASYPNIKKLLHRLMRNESKYNELIKSVCLTNLADVKLEDLFFKPIFQLQKNISLWSDLLNVTPEDHPDHVPLSKVHSLSETFLSQVNSGPDLLQEDRVLKQAIFVEKGNKSKKLVRLFLFKEVLVCTKEKISNGLNINRFVRWFIPLCNLKLETITKDCFDLQSMMDHENELNELQQELSRLQIEHEAELQNTCNIENRFLFMQSLMNRKVDALQRKIEKQEVLLSLSLPILPLIVTNQSTKRSYCLLISSQYDQSQWVEAIRDAIKKAPNSSRLSATDVATMVNTDKLALPKSAIEPTESKAHLTTGNLNLIIHKLVGLKEKLRVTCAIETDFLGHFSLKEQTYAVEGREPEWNESFDVDMEGVKMLRILAYKRGKVDALIGKCTLELDREWLSDNSQFQNLMLNDELQLLVTLKFSPQQNMRRKPTMPQPGGMFGISLKKISKKEGVLVPSIIRYCVMEIENRGLMELGIYRVSGLMTEVNKIKSSFDRGDIDGSLNLLEKADVNVVTSLLKLFLRALPEALFTDSRYSDFMRVLDIKDPNLKSELFVNLFSGLPSCNSASISYLLRHILKVAALSHTNKMSLENLATIFGSTMFRPAMPSEPESNEHITMAREAYCAARQAEVLLFYLRSSSLLGRTKNHNQHFR